MEYLRQGHDVAMLNIGDISIYSTCSYILNIIEKTDLKRRFAPEFPAFAPRLARLKKPLVSRKEVLVVAPGYTDELENLISVKGTKVIMKKRKAYE